MFAQVKNFRQSEDTLTAVNTFGAVPMDHDFG